jgi:hypothetical protein
MAHLYKDRWEKMAHTGIFCKECGAEQDQCGQTGHASDCPVLQASVAPKPLPCPLCGGFAQGYPQKQYKMLLQDWHEGEEALYQPYMIKCQGCGLTITRSACNAEHGGQQGASKQAKADAIKAWNTRVVKEDA